MAASGFLGADLAQHLRAEALPAALRRRQLRPCRGSYAGHVHILVLAAGSLSLEGEAESRQLTAPAALILPPTPDGLITLEAGSEGWLLGLSSAILGEVMGARPELELMMPLGRQVILAPDLSGRRPDLAQRRAAGETQSGQPPGDAACAGSRAPQGAPSGAQLAGAHRAAPHQARAGLAQAGPLQAGALQAGPLGAGPLGAEGLCAAILQETAVAAAGQRIVVLAYLRLLIVAIWRASHQEQLPPQFGSESHLIENFRREVELHFRQHLSVDDYALRLGVSPSRLRRVCQRQLQQRPLELIHRRLLREARAWLEHSGKGVSEIALALGFAEASEFSHFFKRGTGFAPSQFRARAAAGAAADAAEMASFADWP